MASGPSIRNRILVVGATGMLGHAACRFLGTRFDIRASCRGDLRSHPGLAEILPSDHVIEQCDARDPSRLHAVICALRPAFVLNCVGVIKQKRGAEDPVQSIALNALLPHQLAQWCTEQDAKLIHISTDCVFSGAKGGYRESDAPDCTDLYGRSKLLGEVARPPHLTLRTSMIGRQLRGSESLVEWFLSQRGGHVRGFTRAIFSGLTTRALIDAIAHVALEAPHLTGLYQLAGPPLSKHELLVRLDRLLQLGTTVEADDSFICDRSLDGSRFWRESGADAPTWEAMLADLAADAGTYDRWRGLSGAKV